MACLKLQAIHEARLFEEERRLQGQDSGIAKDIADEIVSFSHTVLKDVRRLEALYEKVIQFCFTRYVGAPWVKEGDDSMALKDTRAALESAFPISGLRSLFGLTPRERFRHLEELSCIVLGIRIFNSLVGSGTALCLPDPKNLLTLHSPDLPLSIEQEIEEGEKQIQELVKILLHSPVLLAKAGSETAEQDLALISAQHIYMTQLNAYRRALLTAFLHTRHHLKEAVSECSSEIVGVGEQLNSQPYTSRDDVFPKFSRIAVSYRKAFQENEKLCSLNCLVAFLASLAGEHTLDVASNVESACRRVHGIFASVGQGDQEECRGVRSAENAEKERDDSEVERPDGEPPREFDGKFELGGNCAWCLAKYAALVPADRSIAAISYGGDAYAFSTLRGAKEFAQHPDRLLSDIRQQIRRQPALIHLLTLDRLYPRSSLRNILKLQRNIATRLKQETPRFGKDTATADQLFLSLHEPRNADAAVMTPVHFETLERDTSYHWNEWELRRRALKIADILNRTTRSSQTKSSHCRMEQETQVYPLKEKEQNTMKSKGTSAIRTKKYITGLRGKTNTKAETVKVELDL
ncbi:C6orf165-like protein [Toxoplasma gondii CAST]|uniref:Cilia- and flagella-associated protein 206 n=1 Tax=Toxoplasma gondii CAST TaxID=943122 RepID=A0A3R8AIC0_TOXGO|nr:C6orf165-like protein [Toxoplasma gondii CAST]